MSKPIVTFWLSRSTKIHGGTYTLTTYPPKKNPDSDLHLSWFFWANEGEVNCRDIRMRPEHHQAFEARLGRQLEYGEALNLSTGETYLIADAPEFKRP